MVDVLKIIQNLRDRLWSKYGDVLVREYTQDEIHMTYYAGELLRRHGFEWFKADGQDGACYTEKAMHAAFIAGQRVGKQDAEEMAKEIVQDRLYNARMALDGYETP